MPNQIKVQNFYSSIITSNITGTGDTTFTVAVIPTYSNGFLCISPDNATQREIVYYHDVVGSTIHVRAENRGLDGTSAKTHTSSESIAMKDVAGIFNTFSDMIPQTFHVEKIWGLNVTVWWGYVEYNWNPQLVPNTNILLTNNTTNYIVYDPGTNTLTASTVNSWNIKADITCLWGVITSITYRSAKESYLDPDAYITTITTTVWFSLADYICDGTADNVQIQQAIDYLESLWGGKLIIKEGSYNIAATITVLSDNITIEGFGWKTLLTLANGVNNHVIRVWDELWSTFYKNILIRDIYIEWNKANQSQIGSIYPCGIHFEKCNMSIADNIIAHNCWSLWVWFTYWSKNKVINCTLNNHWYNGIGINESYETLVSNNCCAWSGHAWLILKNTVNCTVTGNQFSYNSGGIAVNYSKYCTITWNDCSHWYGSSGIWLIWLEWSSITGNICRKNSYDGMRMDWSRGNTISWNQFTWNSQITSNTYSWISLMQNIAVIWCTDNLIIGNNCWDNQYPDPETQKYWITENDALQWNNRNMYAFNVCRTNITGSVDLYGANSMDVSNWNSLIDPFLYSMKWVGAWTSTPDEALQVVWKAKVWVNDTNYAWLSTLATSGTIFDIEVIPDTWAWQAILRYCRATNTTWSVGIQVCKWNNTATINSFISWNWNSYFNVDSWFFGIGTNNPTQTLSLSWQAARKIWMERHITADTTGNNLTIEAGGATVGATNKAGWSLFLRSWVSTGSARSSILFETNAWPGAGTGEWSFISNWVLFWWTTTPVFAFWWTASFSNQVDGNGMYVLGTWVWVFGMIRQTTANTAGNGLTVRASGATSGATDKNGGTLNLTGWTATGTGSSSVTISTATPQGSTNTTDNTPSVKITVLGNGNVGIGQTTPTASLHLKAGTTAAGTAPIKLTAGTNMAAVENWAFEYDGTNLYFTTGWVRKTVTLV